MTAKRVSTGKRLRFEVFKRDGFACQYCGAQPPDVVLVLDHVQPVAKGGNNSELNLITACETCNQGKAAKVLGDVRPQPDADLLYLQAQQERAELQRYVATTTERDGERGRAIALIQDHFAAIANGGWVPSEGTLWQVLRKYNDPEIVDEAIMIVAGKVADGYLQKTNWLPYLWGVARNLTEKATARGLPPPEPREIDWRYRFWAASVWRSGPEVCNLATLPGHDTRMSILNEWYAQIPREVRVGYMEPDPPGIKEAKG